ncbi:MAG: hypothetical protein ACW981_11400 [Candidatus Hodarchaeales archaeon]
MVNNSKIQHEGSNKDEDLFTDPRLDDLLKESLQYFQISVIVILLMLLVALIHMGWSHTLHLTELF